MSFKRAIENEIKIEKRVLDRLNTNKEFPDKRRLICRGRAGKPQFYFGDKGNLRYARKSDYPILEDMYRDKLKEVTADVLEGNIEALARALNKIRDYDAEAASELMPLAYRRLKEFLESKAIKELNRGTGPDKKTEGFPQSENGKNPEGLKYRTSFGLLVRSKNEMLIAEALYKAGLEFCYEKALEVVSQVPRANGQILYNRDVIYPDFTILLPDGQKIYWEHFGMMDDEKYYSKNISRLKLYFANGIYPPKNLILTVDGNKMPFDMSAVWRITEGFILPQCI